jgi:branched-chain amino acid transport system substrate-binding protein
MRLRTPLLLVLGLAGCRPAPSHVRMGVVLGGSGIAAARLAVADANADPRARRAHLTLQLTSIEQSSASEPLLAIAAAESLTADPAVVAVLGHGNSAASIAAAQIYNSRRVPQLAPSSTAPLYTRAGPYSFRIVPDDTHQGRELARILAADTGRTRVAIVYVNDDYGRALWKSMRGALDGSRLQVVYETPVLEGWSPELMGLVARSVADAHPQVVCWLARTEDLRTFRRLLRPLAPGTAFLASDAVDNPAVYGPGNADFTGLRFVRFVDPADPDSALQAFRARYRAVRHEEATADAVLAYDATRLLAEAVLSGARTRGEVRAWLAPAGRPRPPFHGLAGPFGIDGRGNGMRRYLVGEVGSDGVVRAVGRP